MSKQDLKKIPQQPDNSSKSVELVELEQELIALNPQIFQGVPADNLIYSYYC